MLITNNHYNLALLDAIHTAIQRPQQWHFQPQLQQVFAAASASELRRLVFVYTRQQQIEILSDDEQAIYHRNVLATFEDLSNSLLCASDVQALAVYNQHPQSATAIQAVQQNLLNALQNYNERLLTMGLPQLQQVQQLDCDFTRDSLPVYSVLLDLLTKRIPTVMCTTADILTAVLQFLIDKNCEAAVLAKSTQDKSFLTTIFADFKLDIQQLLQQLQYDDSLPQLTAAVRQLKTQRGVAQDLQIIDQSWDELIRLSSAELKHQLAVINEVKQINFK